MKLSYIIFQWHQHYAATQSKYCEAGYQVVPLYWKHTKDRAKIVTKLS